MTELLAQGLVAFSLATGQFAAQPIHDDLVLTGRQIEALQPHLGEHQIYIEVAGRYYLSHELGDLSDTEIFHAQWGSHSHSLGESDDNQWRSDYDRRNVPYYDSRRLRDFVQIQDQSVREFGYVTEVIGQSIEGRDLFAIYPQTLQREKKTVVIIGRQHGDEGSQSYIFEGFFNRFAGEQAQAWRDEFQVIMYPMLNPDGVEAHSRYNADRRDLNREWRGDKDHALEGHEIGIVHRHLDQLLTQVSNVVVMIDLHGSFTGDFMYRVEENYISPEYYARQTPVIQALAPLDPWQKGTFIHSNGEPGMFRIVMGQNYGLNALTHETPRDLPLRGPRQIRDLNAQGEALFTAIADAF